MRIRSSLPRALSLLALCTTVLAASLFAADQSAKVESADFTATIDAGWLTSWTNKRTGETFDFGKPANAEAVPSVYQPGNWPIPGYDQEKKASEWSLSASASGDALDLQQQVSVSDGLAQSVQWSLRIPLNKIDGSYWPIGLSNTMLAMDARSKDAALAPSYYFNGRNGIISSHTWRSRYYIIQGKKGGLVIYVDDPELEHFNAVEMDPKKYPEEVILTNRSIASPPWVDKYTGSKWVVVQYDGWVNNGALLVQNHLAKAYALKPLSERPTAWVKDLAFVFVKGPLQNPPLGFAGDPKLFNYTEKWEESIKLVDDWLDNLAKVVDPDKVMFYLVWWRYAGADTFFPDTSVDPFFAHVAGRARRKGFHIMLHFHNHLAHDAGPFFGRYVRKQDEWHKAAYPNRPNVIGDTKGEVMWGVGYDFLRRQPMVQADKDFGGGYTLRQGLPVRMTGYQMTPAYEGWRYMKVAEILSAIRATGADAIHIDVPAVWPEGKERYGINSQQGSREFFKLLRKTLDENGLEKVAIATEGSPGEGYMKYVDMAQLVRGYSTLGMINGIMVDTMIELQVGNDLDKANELRKQLTARYPTAEASKAKAELRFDQDAVRANLGKIREFGEPNVDAMIIAPYVRAYPHLGAASPTMGGNPGDPNIGVHNQVFQSLHTWATLQRDAPFSTTAQLQMFMDTAPWDALPEIKSTAAESRKIGVRASGHIFNQFNYGEFALTRFWAKNQPRFAPLGEWQKGDVARYKLANGSALVIRRTAPLNLNLSVDGKTLADLDVFTGWKNNDQLLKDYGPTFLLNQLDIPPKP